MNIQQAYLYPVSMNAFHHPSGLNGRVIGLTFVIPDKSTKERLCYKLQWDDMEDYVALSSVVSGDYEFSKSIKGINYSINDENKKTSQFEKLYINALKEYEENKNRTEKDNKYYLTLVNYVLEKLI
jgi:hypothetical protein